MMRLLTMAVLVLAICSCSVQGPGLVPQGASSQWTPERPQEIVLPGEKALPDRIEALIAASHNFSLSELLQLALETNPRTRGSWRRAESAYASLGMERSGYYPQVAGGARYLHIRRPAEGSGIIERVNKGPFANLDWLLFDFGGREARVREQFHNVLAANYTHNAAIQDVILQIQASYYQYISIKALASVQEATLREAQTNLEAAEERRRFGLATIADVLQAQTARSNAQLALISTEGRILSVRGAVLTAAGISPSAQVDVETIALDSMPVDAVRREVAELVRLTEEKNPQLAALRERVAQAQAHVEAVRARAYPSMRAEGTLNEFFRQGKAEEDYLMGVTISLPVFTGFSYSYELAKAKKDAAAVAADLDLSLQARTVSVWDDYYANRTAEQRIATSDALHASARQSQEVALARYKEGAGTIIDLLSAQASLASARAAQVQARADWLLSLAQLRYDIGVLGVELFSLGKDDNP